MSHHNEISQDMVIPIPKIGTINRMRDGSVSLIEDGPTFWQSFTVSKVNDGNKFFGVVSSYANTVTADPADNNNRGIEVTFNTSLAIKRFNHNSYWYDIGETGLNCDFEISYHNGSDWVIVDTLPVGLVQEYNLDFNLSGSISSTRWRYVIRNFTGIANFYAYELEAYD